MTDDLDTRLGHAAEDLSRFEEAGLIEPAHRDGAAFYAGHELRLAVIAKAQMMGFSFDEIAALIRFGMN